MFSELLKKSLPYMIAGVSFAGFDLFAQQQLGPEKRLQDFPVYRALTQLDTLDLTVMTDTYNRIANKENAENIKRGFMPARSVVTEDGNFQKIVDVDKAIAAQIKRKPYAYKISAISDSALYLNGDPEMPTPDSDRDVYEIKLSRENKLDISYVANRCKCGVQIQVPPGMSHKAIGVKSLSNSFSDTPFDSEYYALDAIRAARAVNKHALVVSKGRRFVPTK